MRERKLLEVLCAPCNATGAHGGRRCHECRGRGLVKIRNPFYVPPGQFPTWFQLGGGEGWAREIRRQLALSPTRTARAPQQARFSATCRLLQPWRIRSPVHFNSAAIAPVLELLEAAHGNGGRFLDSRFTFNPSPGWSAAELGELLVEVRNRARLWELGRTQAKAKGPRFDVDRIPLERLEALIQRHPNLELVEQLRDARNRRLAAS